MHVAFTGFRNHEEFVGNDDEPDEKCSPLQMAKEFLNAAVDTKVLQQTRLLVVCRHPSTDMFDEAYKRGIPVVGARDFVRIAWRHCAEGGATGAAAVRTALLDAPEPDAYKAHIARAMLFLDTKARPLWPPFSHKATTAVADALMYLAACPATACELASECDTCFFLKREEATRRSNTYPYTKTEEGHVWSTTYTRWNDYDMRHALPDTRTDLGKGLAHKIDGEGGTSGGLLCTLLRALRLKPALDVANHYIEDTLITEGVLVYLVAHILRLERTRRCALRAMDLQAAGEHKMARLLCIFHDRREAMLCAIGMCKPGAAPCLHELYPGHLHRIKEPYDLQMVERECFNLQRLFDDGALARAPLAYAYFIRTASGSFRSDHLQLVRLLLGLDLHLGAPDGLLVPLSHRFWSLQSEGSMQWDATLAVHAALGCTKAINTLCAGPRETQPAHTDESSPPMADGTAVNVSRANVVDLCANRDTKSVAAFVASGLAKAETANIREGVSQPRRGRSTKEFGKSSWGCMLPGGKVHMRHIIYGAEVRTNRWGECEHIPEGVEGTLLIVMLHLWLVATPYTDLPSEGTTLLGRMLAFSADLDHVETSETARSTKVALRQRVYPDGSQAGAVAEREWRSLCHEMKHRNGLCNGAAIARSNGSLLRFQMVERDWAALLDEARRHRATIDGTHERLRADRAAEVRKWMQRAKPTAADVLDDAYVAALGQQIRERHGSLEEAVVCLRACCVKVKAAHGHPRADALWEKLVPLVKARP